MPKQQDFIKPLILIGLISSAFIFSSIVISSYPQHIYLNNQTVIDSTVGYFTNNTVNIRGNQVQYSSGDVIPLSGRDYIKITGRQVQLGGSNFISGIRTVTASLSQNVLFEQKIGTFPINGASKVIIDDVTINLIPFTKSVLNIRTQDSNYNVEFVSDTIYITSKNVMLKLKSDGNSISIYVIGTKNYNKIVFVRI